MMLQATVDLEDLTAALGRLTPLEFRLGDPDGAERVLFVERPDRVTLVPDKGLRIETTARLRWTIAGIVVPVTVSSAQLLLTPEIEQKNGRDILHFSFFVEHADLKHVPAFVDTRIIDQVNESLRADGARVEWDFLRTLTFSIKLPPRLKSAQRFDLDAQWGAVKVTDRGLVFSVGYHSAVEAKLQTPQK
jgi:hypothetical protein